MISPRTTAMMTLDNLLQGYADVTLPDIEVQGISADSQRIKSGDVFIALSGYSRHAIDFVVDAVNAGAVAVIYDADDSYCKQRIPLLAKQLDIIWIPVKHLRQVSGEIASRFYGHPSRQLQLIGITGTDGKTSVTHMLVQALNKLDIKTGSVGTLGYGVANQLQMTAHTTPEAIQLQSLLFNLQQKNCAAVVMEVSSHALDQYRVSGCQFDIAVLTNLGSDHLDYHGDQALYAAAKSRLFAMPGLKARVLNLDDDLGFRLAQQYQGETVAGFTRQSRYAQQALVYLVSSELNRQGLKVVIACAGQMLEIQTGLIGDFNKENLLACSTVLLQLGYNARQIEQAMQGMQPIPGRMEFFPAYPEQPAVVIDFAHTEQALAACLQSVKGTYSGSLTCVFGCGGDRDQGKRANMGAVAEQLADRVILTDDNPRNEDADKITRQILTGFDDPQAVAVIHDRRQAIETALQQAGEDDLVVIAGKGHEQFQLIKGDRIPFSDHFVVNQIREGQA
ncbi:MAG: UDP-N-acetylmuramoyl-L-alanyl-D-glutamate--2,6-diaminopimelate ligase [Gammaproteobacteria bacterium]|nr:UDP-N-acetylmuramoyl-L-alanyl-D-glutamate--2,6-diaminopimelate ligase [Gammaproteobacteria bacterium]